MFFGGEALILAIVMVSWSWHTVTYHDMSGPVTVTTTYGPIQLRMQLNKTQYSFREPVPIMLTITNLSNDTILLAFNYPCKTNFRVYDGTSQQIFEYFSSRIWPDYDDKLVLAGGEAFSQTLKWKQLEIGDDPLFDQRQVSPGIYYIVGLAGHSLYYVGPPEEHGNEYDHFIEVETPQVEIQITWFIDAD